MSAKDCEVLFESWSLLFKARALKRLLLGSEVDIESAPDMIKLGLAKLLGHANFQESCSAIAKAKVNIAQLFEDQIGYPNSTSLPERE